ncbi:hypothetical protein VaNZ11_009105 [Volvox africanus]|uniref:Uncharacterized protein n=1 Tax=Volvox africanus TaxID=51714 RepID=A0ABQ5S6L4_9CHLO|nr:hypothetical protein VaNZ11_009105 [Volvox africanus]
MSAVHHNHVESVSSNEWEDEASVDQSDAGAEDAERTTKVKHLRNAAAALRSSFTALKRSSASGEKKSPSGRRDSTSGFVGSLLHGLANAVGLHRENSPARQSSAQDLSTGGSKAASGHSHTLARLSSAAMMRAEIQNFSQFGDLRNDSFTSRSCAKLRRRSSLLLPRLSDVSMSMAGGAPGPSILTGNSGDLDRRSTPGYPYTTLARLTCPGELPSPVASPNGASACSYAAAAAVTAAALATPPVREQQPKGMTAAAVAATATAASPFQSSSTAVPREVAGGGGGGGGSGNGLRARRSSCGGPQLQGSLVLEITSLPAAVSPHPPLHPPPQTRPSGSSLSPTGSRTASCDRLPPMTPLGAAGSSGGSLMSVRDRPPTPRGSANVSPSSTLAKVLDSFHLPDILVGGSGRSVTERRSSVTGGGGVGGSGASFTRPADIGMPRSRRNSVCSGQSVTGPGGAAISASLAKRAAAAATVAGGSGFAAASAQVGSSSLPSPIAPSSASWTSQSRPSGSGSAAKKTASHNAGILQEFHNSLELDDDGALAAVDAEFDRRFRQTSLEAPGAIDSISPTIPQRLSPQHPQPHHLQPLNHPNQQQVSQLPSTPLTPSPSPPQALGSELTPRAPASERTAMQNNAPRRSYVVVDIGGGSAAASGLPTFHVPRRVSCPTTTMTCDGPDDGDGGTDPGLSSSIEAPPTYERNSHKMRLASIRLSYAEGIVSGGGGGGGNGGGGGGVFGIGTPQLSIDVPPAVLPPARGPSATWAPQPPAGSAPPPSGRSGPVHLAAAVAMAGDAAV